MPADEREDLTVYEVVVNHEEQYSIWPAHKELPLGWSKAGKQGLKAECLDLESARAAYDAYPALIRAVQATLARARGIPVPALAGAAALTT